MFDTEKLLGMGLFSQVIPIWQVFFFIGSLLPFLLMQRTKICLLLTYMFTYYLGFMVQWGDYLAASGTLGPFVLYALSGAGIAVFFVATFFAEEPTRMQMRWWKIAERQQESARL
jgi:hypothetical protein